MRICVIIVVSLFILTGRAAGQKPHTRKMQRAEWLNLHHLSGAYVAPPRFDGYELRLEPDSTFTATLYEEMSSFSCHGRWRAEGINSDVPLLYLTSDTSSCGIISVEEIEDESDSLKFHFEDSSGDSDVVGAVSVESPSIWISFSGNAARRLRRIERFSFVEEIGQPGFVGSLSFPSSYEVKNPKANMFRVTVARKRTGYLYLNNEKIWIRPTELYFPLGEVFLRKVK